MRVVVVGGAGAMGRWTVRDLTESEGVDEVVVADLDGSRASPLTWAVPLLPERAAAQPAASLARDPSRSATTTSSTPSDSVRSRTVQRPIAPAPPTTTTRIQEPPAIPSGAAALGCSSPEPPRTAGCQPPAGRG